ncbi:MAG: ankyrin repeat domain-containing protein [Treponema sp.]|nr:ankyrin repeat domain-containing protein [Treponema sp.]
MSSRRLSLAIKICFAGIILGFLAGCASGPVVVDAPPPVSAAPAPVEDDIWTLLASGETDKARSLFSGRVNVNETDSQGKTPLHYAAENKDSVLAAFFLALGANVDAVDNDQRTPLSISAEKLDAPTAKILAAAGANIHYPMRNSGSPARVAVRENGDLLSALLNQSSLSSVDSSGRTILHIAAEAGNSAAVETILRAGNNPFGKDREGKTALDLAFERTDSRNHAAVAERLILAGAVSDHPIYSYFAPAAKDSNYDLRNADGMAPLHYMAREGYMGYLSFALERGANVNIKNASGASPLHEATRAGNFGVIEKLLDSRAEINTQDAKGNSVLHIAGPSGAGFDYVSLLLSRGANPNLRDEHGDSPLHVAMLLNKSSDVVRALLAAGADVTIRNLDGKTPLYLAVEKARADKIPLLLNYNADIFAVDNNGVTPFEKALDVDPNLVAYMITDKTVLQNDSNGNTILHLTVREGSNIAIVNAILSRNVSVVNARNKEGDTSLTIAVRKDNEAAGTLLLNKGADIFAVNAKGESPLSLTFPPPESRSSDLKRWMISPQTLTARDGLGNTALHYAAQWRLDYWIPLLIQMNAATEAINATGETPLFFAARYNWPSTIRLLVANGASLAARDFLGNSVLHAAVRWNAYQGAEAIIDLGLDVNCHALNGKTPLHDSIRWWMPEMQALLIKSGADIELRDKDGNTAFMEAVMAGNSASMEQLARLGADTKTRNFKGDTALHVSAAIDRIDLSTQLLAWGVSIHARNAQDRTPFQIALNSSSRLIRTFLTRDRINTSDDFGYSPLHIAVQENASPVLVSTILELGARQNSVDSEGRTPLRVALDLNHLETARLLADSGSDVFYAARDGKTPADISIDSGEAMVTALFSGSSINAKDPLGNTVLHYAARHGDPQMVSLLLSLGARKEIKNIAAESPVDIAVRWRNPEAAALLN